MNRLRLTEEEWAAIQRGPLVRGKHDRARLSPVDLSTAALTPTDGAKLLLSQIIAAKLPGRWYREFTFHESRDWRLDVAGFVDDLKLAIEVDGGVHRIKKRFLGDLEKQNALTFCDWRLLRCTPRQVRSGDALTMVRQFLITKGLNHVSP